MGRVYVAKEPEVPPGWPPNLDYPGPLVPPNWNPGWTFPGPPWPPGFDDYLPEEITATADWVIGRGSGSAAYPPVASLEKDTINGVARSSIFGHYYQSTNPVTKALQCRFFANYTIPSGYEDAYGIISLLFASRDLPSEIDGYNILIYKLNAAINEPASGGEIDAAWSASKTLVAGMYVDNDSFPKAPAQLTLEFVGGPFSAGNVTLLFLVDKEVSNTVVSSLNTWQQFPDFGPTPTLTLYG